LKRRLVALTMLLALTLCYVISPVRAIVFLSGWGYRQPYDLTYAGSLSNYPIFFNVYKGEGTSSGDNVYLNDHCSDFPNDINFTDSSNNLLYCWVEDSNSSWAGIWVNAVTVPDTDLYVYYGNPEQTSFTSDGNSVFSLFDHFDEWNATSWGEQPGYVTIADSTLIITATSANNWLRGLTSFGPYDLSLNMRRKVSWITATWQKAAEAGFSNGLTPMDTFTELAYDSIYWRSITKNDDTATWIASTIARDYNFHLFNFTWKSGECKLYVDSILATTHNTNIPDEECPIGFSAYDAQGTETRQTIDYLFLRKWVSPEPTKSWGSEESAVKTVTFYFYEGGQLQVDGDLVANGTESEYANGTIIGLAALPSNSSYVFYSFLWDSDTNGSNPYNLTITSDLTVWCIFDVPEDDTYVWFTLSLVWIPCALALFIVWKKRFLRDLRARGII